jgi:hypothetical protein
MNDQETMATAETQTETSTLFDELAGLVPEERLTQYYRVIAHTRTLSPNDEMLRILEAMGVLALLTRETPAEIASERKVLQKILETSATQASAVEREWSSTQRALNLGSPSCQRSWNQGWIRLELRNCSAKVFDRHFSAPVCQIPQRRLVSLVPK